VSSPRKRVHLCRTDQEGKVSIAIMRHTSISIGSNTHSRPDRRTRASTTWRRKMQSCADLWPTSKPGPTPTKFVTREQYESRIPIFRASRIKQNLHEKLPPFNRIDLPVLPVRFPAEKLHVRDRMGCSFLSMIPHSQTFPVRKTLHRRLTSPKGHNFMALPVRCSIANLHVRGRELTRRLLTHTGRISSWPKLQGNVCYAVL
jgi:hypothetical protein